jgi:asparaginyl-tRNA synthetase
MIKQLNDLTSIFNLEKKEKKAVFKINTGILKIMVNKLVEKGFYWLLPVILAKSTDPLWPDTQASIEQRIEIEIYNEKVKTMQSMIIHKRILVSSGIEKIFFLSPNIRIERRERAETGRHLYEFTQLDVEAAYWKMEDIFKLFEELIVDSITYIKKNFSEELEILKRKIEVPEVPFKIFKRTELEEKYGKNWELTISKSLKNPVWVTNIPREFYDYEDEKTGEWRNFDLILPEGYGEVISGAEREYEYEKIIKKMERDGINKNDYKTFLSFAKEGKLKPSTGAGLGVERFISYICGVKHVAEVQPFPRIPGFVSDL